MDGNLDLARLASRVMGELSTCADASDRQQFLTNTFGVLRKAIPYDYAEITAPIRDGAALAREWATGWNEEDSSQELQDFELGPHGEALLINRAVLVGDLKGYDRFIAPPFYHKHAVRSLLLVPLPAGTPPSRLLGLFSRQANAYGERELNLIISCAGVIGMGLKRYDSLRDAVRKFESAADPRYRIDQTGKYLALNRAFAHLAGYPSPEAFLADFSTLDDGFYVSKESPARIKSQLDQHDWLHPLEARVRKANGTAIWVRERAEALRGAHETATAWEMQVEEITSQQREVLASVESLQRARDYAEALIRCGTVLRGTMQRSLQAICQIVAQAMKLERVSIWMQNFDQGSLDLLASFRDPQALTPVPVPSMEQGRNWLAALDERMAKPTDPTNLMLLWQSRMAEPSVGPEEEVGSKIIVAILLKERLVGALSVESIGKDRVWTREDSSFLAAVSSQLSLVIEGQRLRLSETRYRILAENATDLISRHTMTGTYTYVTPSCRAILGFEPEQMIGRSIFDFMHPDDRISIESSLSTILGSPSTTLMDYRIRHNDGSYVWVESTSRLVRDPLTDQVEEFLVCSRDVTERRRVEQAMRESEANFRFIFEASLDVIIIIDAKNAFIRRMNRPASRVLLYEPNQMIGQPFTALLPTHSELRAINLPEMLTDFLTHQEASGAVFESQPILRADGSQCSMDMTVTEILWENERAILLTLRDVTERNIIEEERMKMSKLESVGILAGGIAHDFNNLLMAIKGNIEMAGLDLGENNPAAECLADANSACQRAEGLARQLLTFAKGGEPIKKKASLAKVIRETAGFSLRGSKTVAKIEIAPDLWNVEIDEGQISQTLNNLIINADQAMPSGGTVRIICENLELPDGLGFDLPAGNYVRVSVKDDGIGIPRELLSKIFDPYYTTKPKGSGLGLATCYSIIKKHGGHLRAESEVGQGALFEFYLPAQR